jgi:hypothetical protein
MARIRTARRALVIVAIKKNIVGEHHREVEALSIEIKLVEIGKRLTGSMRWLRGEGCQGLKFSGNQGQRWNARAEPKPYWGALSIRWFSGWGALNPQEALEGKGWNGVQPGGVVAYNAEVHGISLGEDGSWREKLILQTFPERRCR